MIFAELIMAVFGVPVNFTASLQHGWKLGKPFCEVHGFALTLESKYFSVLLIIKNATTVQEYHVLRKYNLYFTAIKSNKN